MLERMRRGYTRQAYDDLVQHVREVIPGVALSTDIISGVYRTAWRCAALPLLCLHACLQAYTRLCIGNAMHCTS